MVTIHGDRIWRDGQEIGWVTSGEVFDRKGNRVGYFSNEAIYDSGYNKIAYIEGDAVKGNGQNFYMKDSRKHVSGGNLSDSARAAIKILFGN